MKILISLFVVMTIDGFSQTDFTNYKFIKSANPVPTEVYQDVYEHLEQNTEVLENANIKKSLAKKAEKRYLSSSYAINILFTSGVVRVYAVKSATVNAFTTNNGSIFINLGLIAQCTNEAQLAFVIGHEITHYQKQHSLKDILEDDKASRRKGQYDKMSKSERLSSLSRFSKDQEIEADKGGFDLFVKSDYGTKNIANTFDILKYSYLPFDDVKYDLSFLETNHLKFPSEYKLSKINEIGKIAEENEKDGDDEDEHASHPSCGIRKKIIEDLISKGNTNGTDFIQSKEKFEEVRDIVRFEITYLYLTQGKFGSSIYNAFLLSKKYPNNKFLTKCVAMSLERLCEYQTSESVDKYMPTENEIEGEIHALYHFIDKSTNAEQGIYVTSVAFAKEATAKFPGDKDFVRILKRSMYLQKKSLNLSKEDFSEVPFVSEKKSAEKALVDTTINQDNLDKYEKIKQKELKNIADTDTLSENTFWKYAYVDYMKDTNFTNLFDMKIKKKKNGSTIEKDLYTKSRKGIGMKESFCIVSPNYLKYKNNFIKEKSTLMIEKTLRNRTTLGDRVIKVAELAKVETTILNKDHLTSSSANVLNDYYWSELFLSNYFSDNVNDVDRIIFQETIDDLKTRHISTNFYYSGMVEQNRRGAQGFLILSILYFPLCPLTVPAYVNSKHSLSFYSIMLNMEQNKILYLDTKEVKSRDIGGLVESFYYANFRDIKKKSKKSKSKAI
jgi:beta-barrel assembly-enhancing protease